MKCFVFLMVLGVAKAAIIPTPPTTMDPLEGESTNCQCKPKSECPQLNEATSELLDMISPCEENMVCCPTLDTPEIDTEEYNKMCRAANSKSPFPDPRCCGRHVFNETKAPSEDRIYNGQKSQPGQYPWMVRIYTHNMRRSNCVGFLIGSRHVLTADHCVFDLKGIRKVGLGCGDSCEQVMKFSYTERAIVNKSGMRLDIAILRLAEEVTFSNTIRPICLPAANQAWSAKSMDTNKEFVVSGWGRTEFGKTKKKMHAIIHETPHHECEQMVKTMCSNNTGSHETCYDFEKTYNYNIQGHLICAGSEKGNTCVGDSGGPLMQQTYVDEKKSSRYEAVGITTTTPTIKDTCEEDIAKVPHIFVQIKEHMDWINRTITKDAKKI